MIVTITPNPAVDEVYTVDEFKPGRWYRSNKVVRSPGGRGVNVSIILKQLGYDSVATGFLAGHSGGYIKDDLILRGITTNFVNIRGENRTNTFVKDTAEKIETAIMEEGPEAPDDAVCRFFRTLDHLVLRATAVHMGGSLPPGLPEDFYRRTVDRVRKKNIPVFVDSSGEALDLAVDALPTAVKIDRRFDDAASEAPRQSIEELKETSKKIFDEGVDWIVTPIDNSSSLFCTTKGFYLAHISIENARTYRAASDAIAAGMIAAREERLGIEDTIRLGMSCVIQTVSCPQKGLPSREAVDATLGDVRIQKL